MGRDRSSMTLGRRLVECGNSRERIVGYVAGWVAMIDGEPVSLVRQHPRHARRDMLEATLARASAAVATVGNARPTLP